MPTKTFTVGWLYPDLMNIYGDRGNILTLLKRAEWRGFDAKLVELGRGTTGRMDEVDVFFFGGGQDREQALVSHDLAEKTSVLREAVESGAAFLAVCGGYQLLGRYYRDVAGEEQPGIGLLPLHTIANKQRMIGDVLLDCGWAGQTLAGFENHAGRTILDVGAEPLGRVVSGFGNDGASGYEGARYKRAYGTYLHGPLLPRNPWFADHLLSEALAHAGGPTELGPLPDELEHEAHAISAARARARGGKF